MRHSDPTANQAIASASRDWKKMANLALRVRTSRDLDWAFHESLRFTGIYRRLLDMPLDELRKAA